MTDLYMKRHLRNLPDLEPDQVMDGTVREPGKYLMLLSMFEGQRDKAYVADYVALSAIWARYSWLRYSDALEYNVEIKFYVEERVKDQAIPVLDRNFVDPSDVIFFNANKLEGVLPHVDGGWITGGMKKAASYNDYRFKNYEWVFDVDSDIFVLSPNKEKLPFFQTFFENCVEDMIGVCWPNFPNPPYPTPENQGWLKIFAEASQMMIDTGIPADQSRLKIPDWREQFEALSSPKLADDFFDESANFLICNGGIVAMPARYMMNERREVCEFLTTACRELLDVEAAMSLYAALGNPLFDVFQDQPICLLHTDKGIEGLREFQELQEKGEPFLLHYSTSWLDYFFQKGIGIDA